MPVTPGEVALSRMRISPLLTLPSSLRPTWSPEKAVNSSAQPAGGFETKFSVPSCAVQ